VDTTVKGCNLGGGDEIHAVQVTYKIFRVLDAHCFLSLSISLSACFCSFLSLSLRVRSAVIAFISARRWAFSRGKNSQIINNPFDLHCGGWRIDGVPLTFLWWWSYEDRWASSSIAMLYCLLHVCSCINERSQSSGVRPQAVGGSTAPRSRVGVSINHPIHPLVACHSPHKGMSSWYPKPPFLSWPRARQGPEPRWALNNGQMRPVTDTRPTARRRESPLVSLFFLHPRRPGSQSRAAYGQRSQH